MSKKIENQLQDEIDKYISLNNQLKEFLDLHKEIIGELKAKKTEIKSAKQSIDDLMIDNDIQEYESGDYIFKLNIKKQKPLISEELVDLLNNEMEKEMKNKEIEDNTVKDIIKNININIHDTTTGEDVKKNVIIRKKKVKPEATKTKKITEKKKNKD